jgi:hypothetical protein
VVQVEERVTGRAEEVASWVPSHAVMAASMNSNGVGARNSLHLHLEVVDVLGIEDQARKRLSVGEFLVRVVGKIALQAARVVRETVAVRDGCSVSQAQVDGAEVDLHILEGPALDAATAGTSGDQEVRQSIAAQVDVATSRNEFSVAGHGESRAVEHGGLLQTSLRSLCPVPVWLIALVAAFVAKSLLVLPGEVSVPSKESAYAKLAEGFVRSSDRRKQPRHATMHRLNDRKLLTSVVNSLSLIDVSSYPIVEA